MTDENWPGDWLRGVLSLCILAVIAQHGAQGTHGYAIAQRLAEHGLGHVKGGTLYPILNRLESEGHVTASWGAGDGGPGRKTFIATRSGHDHLTSRRTAWKRFTASATDLIETGAAR